MKKTTRLLALFLVLVLSLTTFVACKKDAEDKEKEELDPKKAIVGTWSTQIDIADLLTASVQESLTSSDESTEGYAEYFEFKDIEVAVSFDFDKEMLSISLEPADGATDNLEEQFVSCMCDAMEASIQAYGLDLQETLDGLGYETVEEYVSEEMLKDQDFDELFETAFTNFEQTNEYEFDGDKIYFTEEKDRWLEYKFEDEEKVEFEFVIDSDVEVDENTELVAQMLSSTYTKD